MDVEIVPDDHDRAAELQVSPNEKVTVVLPGEAPVITSEVALNTRSVDHAAAFTMLEAGQRGHRDAAAGCAVEPHHRCPASRRPGACAVRRHRDSGFILKDQP